MTEKEYKNNFMDNINVFSSLLKNIPLIVCGIELPVKTNDGKKFIDLVIEEDKRDISPMKRSFIILEFKKNKVDIGAVEQILRYKQFITKQLYRVKEPTAIIVGPDFSDFEKDMCKKNKVLALRYDGNSFMEFQ